MDEELYSDEDEVAMADQEYLEGGELDGPPPTKGDSVIFDLVDQLKETGGEIATEKEARGMDKEAKEEQALRDKLAASQMKLATTMAKAQEAKTKMAIKKAEATRKTVKEVGKVMKEGAIRQKAGIDDDADPNDAGVRAHWERRYMRMKTQMGCTGTGKRVTSATTLADLMAEVTVMDRQANERRAGPLLRKIIGFAINTVESVFEVHIPKAKYDISKIKDTWDTLNTQDKELNDALLHLEIMYGHLFALGPHWVVAQKIGNMFRDVNLYNQTKGQRAAADGNERVASDVREKFKHL